MRQNLAKKFSIYSEILFETKSRSYLGIGVNILFSVLVLVTIEQLFKTDLQTLILVIFILLVSTARWVHLFFFNQIKPKKWHTTFSIYITVTGFLWSVLIYNTLDRYHQDIKIVSLVHMVFSGMIATSAYNLALSKRDYYLFGTQIIAGPFLFFLLNNEPDLNNAFLFTTMALFFTLISLLRQDYFKQWVDVLQRKNELRLIINSFPGGVSLIKNKKYTYVNNLVSKHTGIEALDFVNQPVGFSSNVSSFAAAFEKFESSKKKNWTQELFLKIEGTPKLCLLLFTRMDEDDSIIIAITLDIDNQRKNELALQSAAKMAALGELSSGLAHEINNPLSVISAQVTQLQKSLEKQIAPSFEKNKFETGLQRIYKTVFRISEIVKGLRQIARNDTSDPTEVLEIKDIINDTISICEAKCRNQGIEIKNLLPNDPVRIECHPAQISQVILNLLNNSIYAVSSLAEKWIEISMTKTVDRFYLKFKDSGFGIEQAVVDKIMTPFFTTKPTGKGTGLGLSISKTIIEQHSGKFYYDCNDAHTTFVIELPVV